MRKVLPIHLMLAVVLVTASAASSAGDAAALEFFEKRVRPILANNCYECHGPEKQKSGLRWDHIAFIRAGGDRGAVIEPGEPGKSRMIEAIGYDNVDLQMPPTGKLDDRQIEVLRQWVQMGAPWPDEPKPAGPSGRETFSVRQRAADYWIWQPIEASKPPQVKTDRWGEHAIDRFIAAKLEANELSPAPEADRRTLIRRLYFDLIGLPPTPRQVEAFIGDTSDDAYAKLVDRLLASEHFGERWARHWMDSMRYAETFGHEFDIEIPHAWKYRDYLIRAFNADVPYDQFIVEHLAGDQLDRPRRHPASDTNESILATGWWFLHEQTHAPTDVRQHEADRIDNQIDVLGKTFLGLTLSCARCHDHKFDAISAADYYALAGFVQSSRQQLAPLDPQGRVHDAIQRVRSIRDEADKALAERDIVAPPAAQAEAESGTLLEDFNRESWGDWFVSGDAFGDGPTGRTEWDNLASGPTPMRAGLAHSGRFGGKARGVLRSPTFTIEKPRIFIRAAGKGEIRLIIDSYTLAPEKALLFGGTVAKIDRPDKLGWTAMGQDVQNYIGHRAYLEIIDDDDGHIVVDEIWQADGNLGGRRDEPLSLPAASLDDTTVFDSIQQRFKAAAGDVPPYERALAITDGTGEDSYVHIRGSYKSRGDTVARRHLEAFVGADPPAYGPGSGRLKLARQIVDPTITPLTPRVMVNRVWHHLIGRGLVPSIDNFGKLGQPVTHPQLLDHMAQQFVDDGWSIKRLIRRIVMSRAYRMSSEPADAHAERVDPKNELLHRAHIRRLEGEAIRDAILTVSGQLNDKMFGPSVPVHLTPFMQGRGRPKSGPLDGNGRRSIYTAIRRNFLPPMMLAFDMPIPFTAVGRRSVSNVPAQALTLMNDPFVVQQAEMWAKRELAESDVSPEQRIDDLYLAAFARPATDAERQRAIRFLHAQLEAYDQPADKLGTHVPTWADLCHVLFNVKEFIFIN